MNNKIYELLKTGEVHTCTKCVHAIKSAESPSGGYRVGLHTDKWRCAKSEKEDNPDHWITGLGEPYKYRLCSEIRNCRVCEEYEEKE